MNNSSDGGKLTFQQLNNYGVRHQQKEKVSVGDRNVYWLSWKLCFINSAHND